MMEIAAEMAVVEKFVAVKLVVVAVVIAGLFQM
jgi:hypothetical protein